MAKTSKMDYASMYRKYFVTSKPVEPCKMHYHSFYEIEIITRGEVRSVINGREELLRAGDVMCLLPDDHHDITPAEDAYLFNLSFGESDESTELIDEIFYSGRTRVFHMDDASLERELWLLRVIAEEQPVRTASENKLTDKLFGAALCIISRSMPSGAPLGAPVGAEKTSAKADSITTRAMRYMQKHFSEDITLEDIASEIGLTPQYFSGYFHRKTGVTCKRYLEELRIGYAQNLLATTDLSCTDVCFEVGFGSYSSFLRAYKRVTGQSPRG